jgi:hypothetical protein
MYAISQWLKEVALVAYGVMDANRRADLMRESGGMAAADLSEAQVRALKGFDRLPQALKSPGQVGLAEAMRDSAFMPTLDLAIKSKFNEYYLGSLHKHGDGEDKALAETMTTQHFATYFGTALSRAFYPDYKYDVGSWVNYTYPDVVPDFRDVDRLRMSEPGTLYKRLEKQQASATHIAETVIHYGVEQYGRQFDVSWQTLQNDDLGKIAETPMRMANAARRWLDAWVSALYDNATTQAALLALGAVYGGTGRLTAANLAIGLNAMMQRTDVNGNQMNINRVFLVIPKILQIQAADILQDVLAYGGAGGNVLQQFIAGVYVDPYVGFTSPDVPWYLFAAPAEVPAVTVARLQGWPGPSVTRKRSDIELLSGSAPAPFHLGDFATGDIEFIVQDIIGGWDNASYVGVTDFRGIYYSNGTTA